MPGAAPGAPGAAATGSSSAELRGDGLQRGLMVVHALGETGKAASGGRRIVEVVDLPFHGAHFLTPGTEPAPMRRPVRAARRKAGYSEGGSVAPAGSDASAWRLSGHWSQPGSERASPKAGERYTAFSLYYPEMKDLDNKDTPFAGRTQVSEHAASQTAHRPRRRGREQTRTRPSHSTRSSGVSKVWLKACQMPHKFSNAGRNSSAICHHSSENRLTKPSRTDLSATC